MFVFTLITLFSATAIAQGPDLPADVVAAVRDHRLHRQDALLLAGMRAPQRASTITAIAAATRLSKLSPTCTAKVTATQGRTPSIWGDQFAFRENVQGRLKMYDSVDGVYGNGNDRIWSPYAYSGGYESHPRFWDQYLFYMHDDSSRRVKEIRMVDMGPKPLRAGLPRVVHSIPDTGDFSNLELKIWPGSEALVSWLSNEGSGDTIHWCLAISECKSGTIHSYQPQAYNWIQSVFPDPYALSWAGAPSFVWTDASNLTNWNIAVATPYPQAGQPQFSESLWARAPQHERVLDVTTPLTLYHSWPSVHLSSHYSGANPVVTTQPAAGFNDDSGRLTIRPTAGNQDYPFAWTRRGWVTPHEIGFVFFHIPNGFVPYHEIRVLGIPSVRASFESLSVDQTRVAFTERYSGDIYVASCLLP